MERDPGTINGTPQANLSQRRLPWAANLMKGSQLGLLSGNECARTGFNIGAILLNERGLVAIPKNHFSNQKFLLTKMARSNKQAVSLARQIRLSDRVAQNLRASISPEVLSSRVFVRPRRARMINLSSSGVFGQISPRRIETNGRGTSRVPTKKWKADPLF